MNYSCCESIKTYSDFLNIYAELSKALLYSNSSKFQMSEKCYLILTNFMHSNNLDKEKAIKSISNYLKNLQIVDLKISFEPSTDFLEKAYLMIYQYLNKHFLIKYEVDQSQFLGATICYDGKIYKGGMEHAFSAG